MRALPICYDVVIIGGGVVGCAIARELTRYQLQIALLEQEAEVGFGTSKANSGIIHGGHHAAPGTLKGKLEWAGNQRWDRLCDELGFGFKRSGELTVALSAEEVPILEQLLQHAQAKNIPGLELWDRERTLRAEPNLTGDVVAALYAPATAVINPYEACFGLAESAVRNGLHLVTECPVAGLTAADEGWLVHSPQCRLRPGRAERRTHL
jgi:glycerol-3-phosphate dehydrogenase